MPKDNAVRAVFDCMIYLQATANEKSPAAALLRLVEQEEIVLYLSHEVIEEVKEVLSRPKLRASLPNINDVTVEALFKRLERIAVLVRQVPHVFEYARDLKDEKYINLAAVADAQYLVSRDTDLLELMTGHSEDCKEFRQRFRPLKVVDPISFLHLMEPAKK